MSDREATDRGLVPVRREAVGATPAFIRTSGDFYASLFGWERVEIDAGPLGTYTTFRCDGRDIAGMMNPTIDYTRALGSRWYAYIGVDDLDKYVARATELGAELVAGPDEIAGVGRVALLADPTGALIRLMQPEGQR